MNNDNKEQDQCLFKIKHLELSKVIWSDTNGVLYRLSFYIWKYYFIIGISWSKR